MGCVPEPTISGAFDVFGAAAHPVHSMTSGAAPPRSHPEQPLITGLMGTAAVLVGACAWAAMVARVLADFL